MAANKRPAVSSCGQDESLLDDEMTNDEVQVKRGRHIQARDELNDEEETLEQVILAAVWQGGKLGLSFYEVESATLYFMLESAEREDFLLLSRALSQTAPKTIVLSSKQDERMKDAVRSYVEEGDIAEGVPSRQPVRTMEVLPSADFVGEKFFYCSYPVYDACRRRILALPTIPGVKEDMSEDQKQIYISSLIPLDNVCMVRSMGALLKFLDKHRVGVELEDTSVRIPLLAVKHFSLENLVIVDENTYCALQIFHKESHPSVYKSHQSGSKEGLSLFGIANRTRSKLGTQLLRLWFLRPLKSIEVLRERQRAIALFTQQNNDELTKTLGDCLKNIKNLPRILMRMNTSQASMADWQALYRTAYNAVYIGEVCRTLTQSIPVFKKVSDSFSEDLQKIASLISRIIDFEESSNSNRFVVKPGVDPDLDEKKRTYNGLPDLMTEVARQELANLSEDILECNVIYLPQLGYLLAIPQAEHMKENEDFEIEGLQFVFYSNNTVYYKSQRTRELDALLGDTQCDIIDHETAIMHRLQEVVLEHTPLLLSVMEHSAELDCLLALSLFAKEHNLVQPELIEQNTLAIKAGRHPLQELCVTAFVPNDTTTDRESGRVKILTGPNASGKSVYLKQVGLIVFLAHIGSFVPAESAIIGTVDAIFTRVHTRETVSIPLSTFMIDLNQVSNAVRNCTERSLVILDEFGKGTATNDGLALLTATLRHWINRKEACPFVLVSTHFHSLMHQKLLPNSKIIDYQTMEVLEEADELVFLYHLVDGKSDTSHACHIAASVGLPKEIVQRGAEVSDLIRRNQPVGRRDATSMENQLKRAQTISDRFLKLDLDKDDVQSFLREFVLTLSDGMT